MHETTSRDGTVIGFAKSGAGPALLLVHGTTADHRRWTSIIPRLEPHFTVYAMDRRGRGGSGDTRDYSYLREVEDVVAVVEAIGEPVVVLGHSYGAILSLEAASLTDDISRLILYEPPIPTGTSTISPDVPERMQALIDRGELEAALEIFMREVVRMPEHELETYRNLPMWKGRIQLTPTIPRELNIDRTYRLDPERFAALQTPTMLLLGGDSPPLFKRAIESVKASLPNSILITMPGQQHIAMDTNPDLFVGEVLNYLLE